MKRDFHQNPYRDFHQNPYNAQEQQAADYLNWLTKESIGTGDDPVGFLVASHNHFREMNGDLRDEVKRLRLALLRIMFDDPSPTATNPSLTPYTIAYEALGGTFVNGDDVDEDQFKKEYETLRSNALQQSEESPQTS